MSSTEKNITVDIGTFVKNQINNALSITTERGTYYDAYKQGQVVSVYLSRQDFSPSATAWDTIDTLPAGFKPKKQFYMEYTNFKVRITTAGAIEVYGASTAQITLLFNFTYIV